MDELTYSSPKPKDTEAHEEIVVGSSSLGASRPRLETAPPSPPKSEGFNTLEEELTHPYPSLDYESHVTSPFQEDIAKDVEFRETIRRKILYAAMNAFAWSNARLVHERMAMTDTLDGQIESRLQQEREQGRSSLSSLISFGTPRLYSFLYPLSSVHVAHFLRFIMLRLMLKDTAGRTRLGSRPQALRHYQ